VSAPYRVFWDAKVGNAAEEYEDAFSPGPPVDGAPYGRFAVADGATESSYSRHWALLLAEAYTAGATRPGMLVRRIPALQVAWTAAHRRADLPWYAAEKLKLGAFAALVGAHVGRRPAGPTLDAVAAGDSCLVVVGPDGLRTAWPIERSADFGSSPALLSSVGRAADQLRLMRRLHIVLETSDLVLLMSDAISAWFLGEVEAGGRPWQTLGAFGVGDDELFRAWARDMRSSGVMRNDDVTVALLAIDEAI
jgi:hypothetical protein